MKVILLLSRHFMWTIPSLFLISVILLSTFPLRDWQLFLVLFLTFSQRDTWWEKREAMHEVSGLMHNTTKFSAKTTHIVSQTNAFVTFYYHFFTSSVSQTDVKRLLNFSDCRFIDLLNQQSLYCVFQDSHEESHRRFCLRCCLSLSYHWSANSDLILWLWDYFHKRMVGLRTFAPKSSHVQIFWRFYEDMPI